MALSEIESAFMAYITQYGKSYSTMEQYEMRLRQFALKHAFIQEHNQEGNSYTVGHNNMSDWTEEEFAAILKYNAVEPTADQIAEHTVGAEYTPIDWRTQTNFHGTICMTPIQDQGQCGSCWAFSTQLSLSSNLCIQADVDDVVEYSVQYLVDCVTSCYGCNGGSVSYACEYLKKHQEILARDYPYKGVVGTCDYKDKKKFGVECLRSTHAVAGSVDQMKDFLKHGVLSVSVQANQYAFQSYSTGIFDNSSCTAKVDHATNVVGWGTTSSNVEYWIMRNSWGTTWGESGYMQIGINTTVNSGSGYCGIQSDVQTVTPKFYVPPEALTQ